MSPLLEIRLLTPEETEKSAQAEQEKTKKEEEEMKRIEKILAENGAVALEFYEDRGGIEEHPQVFEQLKEMREKIIEHSRNSAVISGAKLSFDWTLNGDKGSLIVKVKK